MEIIDGAERALAALAAEAAAAREYAQAAEVLALAQAIAGARPRSREEGPVSEGFDARPPPAQAVSHVRRTPGETKFARKQYPQFRRDGQALVKIGWSKSDRAPYEHKSPRAVLDRLLDRLLDVSVKGRRFTSDQLFPLTDERGDEIPAYQPYLCLAWLISIGVVSRHGRQGYTLPVPASFARSAIDRAWNSLVER